MKLVSLFKFFTVCTLSVLLTSSPVKAAEKIYILYGPLNVSVRVDSLTLFAEQGIINSELEYYFRFVGMNEEEKAKLQKLLVRKIDINPLLLSRILNTPKGEQFLENLGDIISIQGGINGKYVLRGALVQAALDENNGFNLINVLQHLSTDVEMSYQDILRILK